MWPFSRIFGKPPSTDDLDWDPISGPCIRVPQTGTDELLYDPGVELWESRARTIVEIYQDAFLTLQDSGWNAPDSWRLVSTLHDQAIQEFLATRKFKQRLVASVLEAADLGQDECEARYVQPMIEKYLQRLRDVLRPEHLAERIIDLYARLLQQGYDIHFLNALLQFCAENEQDPEVALQKFEEETSFDAENALFAWIPTLQWLLQPGWLNDELSPLPDGYTIWQPIWEHSDAELRERSDLVNRSVLDAFADEILWLRDRGFNVTDSFNIVFHVWDEEFSNTTHEFYHEHAACASDIKAIAQWIQDGEVDASGLPTEDPVSQWLQVDLDVALYKMKPHKLKPSIREVLKRLLQRGFHVHYLIYKFKEFAQLDDPIGSFEQASALLDPEQETLNWVDELAELLDRSDERQSPGEGPEPSSSSSSSEDDGAGPHLPIAGRNRSPSPFSNGNSSPASYKTARSQGTPTGRSFSSGSNSLSSYKTVRSQGRLLGGSNDSSRSGSKFQKSPPFRNEKKAPLKSKTPSPKDSSTQSGPRSLSPAESYIKLPSSRANSPQPDNFLSDFRNVAAEQFADIFHGLRARGWGPARAWRVVSVLSHYFTEIQNDYARDDLEGLRGYIKERARDSTWFGQIFDQWRYTLHSPGGLIFNELKGIWPPSARELFQRTVDAAVVRGMDIAHVLHHWNVFLAGTLGRPSDAVDDLVEWLRDDENDSPGQTLFDWIPGFEEVWFSEEIRINEETGRPWIPEFNDIVQHPSESLNSLLDRIEQDNLSEFQIEQEVQAQLQREIDEAEYEDMSPYEDITYDDSDSSHSFSRFRSHETNSETSDYIPEEEEEEEVDDLSVVSEDERHVPVLSPIAEASHEDSSSKKSDQTDSDMPVFRPGNGSESDGEEETDAPTPASFSIPEDESNESSSSEADSDMSNRYTGDNDDQDDDDDYQDPPRGGGVPSNYLYAPSSPSGGQTPRGGQSPLNSGTEPTYGAYTNENRYFNNTRNLANAPYSPTRVGTPQPQGRLYNPTDPLFPLDESEDLRISPFGRRRRRRSESPPRTPPTPRASDMAFPGETLASRFNFNNRCARSPGSAWREPRIKKVEPLRYANRLERPRRLQNTPTKEHQPPSPKGSGGKKGSPRCETCGRALRTTKKKGKKGSVVRRVIGMGGVEKVVGESETLRRSMRTRKKPVRFSQDA